MAELTAASIHDRRALEWFEDGAIEAAVPWAVGIVDGRGYPVSAAVLWWSWWAGEERHGDHVAFGAEAAMDWAPKLSHGFPKGHDARSHVDAVPVGAFIQAGDMDLWGQVIWKEGAHPALAPGSVPGFLSGAPPLAAPDPTRLYPSVEAPDTTGWWDPAGTVRVDTWRSNTIVSFSDTHGAAGPVGWRRGARHTVPDDHDELTDGHPGPFVWERIVVDWYAAFPEPPTRSPQWMPAKRRAGRKMDARGHLLVRSTYALDDGRAGDVDVDDITFAARWLTRRYQNAFAADTRFADVDTGDVEELEDVVLDQLALFDELVAAVAATDGFFSWNGHAVPDGATAPFDGDERVGAVARALTTPAGRAAVTYTSVSPQIAVEFSPDPDGDALTGPGWLCAHAAVHAAVLEHVDDPECHVRLDDPWSGGGIWRASFPRFAVTQDPLIPLGLGWAEHEDPSLLTDSANVTDSDRGGEGDDTVPAPDWWNDDAAGFSSVDTDNSVVWWRFAVTRTDIAAGRLRVPSRASGMLDVVAAIAASLTDRGQEQVVVHLDHARVTLDPGDATQWTGFGTAPGTEDWLQFEWPAEVYAGTFVTVTWQIRGTRIDMLTVPLPEPVTVGETKRVQFLHEFSEPVALAALGLAGSRQVKVRDLVLAAVRDRGEITIDGVRRLDLPGLLTLVFGPDGQVLPQFERVSLLLVVQREANRLVAARILDKDRTYWCWNPSRARTGRPRFGDRGLDDAYGTNGRAGGSARRHYVEGFLRRLQPGHRSSEQAAEAWAENRARLGMPDVPLPDGKTFVQPHLSGTHTPGSLVDDVERILAILHGTGSGHSDDRP